MTSAPPAVDRSRRYPGVRSFDDDDTHRQIFHGRDKDKYDLLQLVLAERLVVLFARSGIGKSSLINAGLMQPLRDKGFFPLAVRISSIKDDPLDSFYRGVKGACEQAKQQGAIEEYVPGDSADWNRTSLWHFVKTLEIWGHRQELLQPVVIVDQFEELFTVVSEKPRKRFIDELADLVRGTCPVGSPVPTEPDGSAMDDSAPYVKVVLAIREDFMANLEEMAERIPAILKTRYRLSALDVEQARRAIVVPAQIDLPQLDTKPFSWSDDALQCTLDFLRKRVASAGGTEEGKEVEPFQLQLVCQHVENIVAKSGLTTVGINELGGEKALDGILTRFYDDSIEKLCARFGGFRLRRRLENFCEYGLITDRGRRLLREESTIERSDRISPDVLAEMVQLRLLRKEPRIGDNYYELTHDTLIAPILANRRQRERRRQRAWMGGAVAAVALVVGTGVVLEQQSAQLRNDVALWEASQERREEERWAQVKRYAREWGAQGNQELAKAFYDVARANGVSINEVAENIGRLIATANVKVAESRIDEALQAYRAAYDTDVAGASDEARDLRDIVPREHIRMGDLLARVDRVADALKLYDEVRMRYPAYQIDADNWNMVCWFGGVLGRADEVLDACERAVEADPLHGGNRDSRGLALATARAGDRQRALGDFGAYVEWAGKHNRPDDEIERRRQWIDALENDRDPFDATTMKWLRDSEESSQHFAQEQLSGESKHDIVGSLTVLVQAWSSDPEIQARLRAGVTRLCAGADSAQNEECDKRWAAHSLPGMEAIQTNPCSNKLRQLDDGLNALAEIFVTDSAGYNVCMSRVTSDYFQADEEWWKAVKENRDRRDDPVSYDESSGATSYNVAVAVLDPKAQDTFLGVLKAVFKTESLSHSIR